MGDVVRMTDWKNRKVKPDSLGRGNKPFRYNPDPTVDPNYAGQTVIFQHIRRILERSIQASLSIGRLPTVQEREMAAVASLGFLMEAINYGKEHGLTVRRRETTVGEPYVYEVIGFKQIVVVK